MAFALHLGLAVCFVAVSAVVPDQPDRVLPTFAAVWIGTLLGCGVSYLLFRYFALADLEGSRLAVLQAIEELWLDLSASNDAAIAITSSKTRGLVIPDQALLRLEAHPKRLRRVLIASADGPDEFASKPVDRGSALDFGRVVLGNLHAGVAYEWWVLNSSKSLAACSDARKFLDEFPDLAQIHVMSSEQWARSPFAFDTIFLVFKDGHTDGYMQLPSASKADVHWFPLPSAVRKEFQGVIEGWREPESKARVE